MQLCYVSFRISEGGNCCADGNDVCILVISYIIDLAAWSVLYVCSVLNVNPHQLIGAVLSLRSKMYTKVSEKS